MTTQVSGDLRVITSTPAKITSVDVRSTTTRPSGDGLMLGQWVTLSKPGEFNAASAEVDFPAVPGPAQIKLFSGGSTVGSVALIVPDAPSASLADCVRNAEMAGDRDVGELAGILEQIRGSVGASAEARAGAEAAAEDAAGSASAAGRDADRAEAAAGEAATEAAGLAADAVRLEVKEDADRSAAGAATATEKAAESAGSATRAEAAEAGAVEAEEGAEAGQELSEDAAAVAVAAAVGAAEASSDKADTSYVDAADQELDSRLMEVEPAKAAVSSEETAWAHANESGDRLPLGYSPDGRLDPTARKIWAEDVNREYTVPGDEYVHALATERGELLIGFRADGTVIAPGLKAESAPSGTTSDFYIHGDGTVQPTAADMSQLTVWGSSTPNLLIPFLTTALSDLPVFVNDQAQGGERVQHAAARMGVIPALIDPVTIPSTGAVAVTSQNFPYYQTIMNFAGTLGGVHGTLGATAETLQFTRTTDGDPVVIAESTPFIPDVGPAQRDHVSIIGSGKNNIRDAGSEQMVIDYNDQMFDYLTPQNPRALILGMHNDRGTTPARRAWAATVNNHLRRRFGPLFIDPIAVITSPDIWDQTGITPTQADLETQALGDLPASLGMDTGHFNAATNTVVAGIIRDRMVSLGWY